MTPAPELRADIEASGAASREANVAHGVLHALDFGGSGPDVLVLPGITSPAITWEFIVRRLGDRLRVVVADLRGRGLSSPSADGPTTSKPTRRRRGADREPRPPPAGPARPLARRPHRGGPGCARGAAAGPALLVDPPLTGPGPRALSDQPRGVPDPTRGGLRRNHSRGGRAPLAELAAPGARAGARWLPTCDERAVVERTGSSSRRTSSRSGSACPRHSRSCAARTAPS